MQGAINTTAASTGGPNGLDPAPASAKEKAARNERSTVLHSRELVAVLSPVPPPSAGRTMLLLRGAPSRIKAQRFRESIGYSAKKDRAIKNSHTDIDRLYTMNALLWIRLAPPPYHQRRRGATDWKGCETAPGCGGERVATEEEELIPAAPKGDLQAAMLDEHMRPAYHKSHRRRRRVSLTAKATPGMLERFSSGLLARREASGTSLSVRGRGAWIPTGCGRQHEAMKNPVPPSRQRRQYL